MHQGQTLREVHANITVEVTRFHPSQALAAAVPRAPGLIQGTLPLPARTLTLQRC